MRFFSIALPLFMGLFVAASPVAVEDKSLAARQLDLASTLNGLQGKIVSILPPSTG
jgi:hypothetical protein